MKPILRPTHFKVK